MADKKEIIKGFTVIDTKTGKYPDMKEIVLEDWARRLMVERKTKTKDMYSLSVYFDIKGFAITEDGSLILADKCGNFAHCPLGRFKIKPIYYL